MSKANMSILLALFPAQKTLSKGRVRSPRSPRRPGKVSHPPGAPCSPDRPRPHLPPRVQQPIRIQVEARGPDGGSCLT